MDDRIIELLDRNLQEVFGEGDSARRRAAIRDIYCEDCVLYVPHGVFVVASFVSPYEESRKFVRGLCRSFTEVYVATPIEECERRDVKGLYAKARRGEIPNFTGVSDPYEVPTKPDVVLDTSRLSVEDAGRAVLRHLQRRIPEFL